MSLFSSKNPLVRCGAIVDVGSGSVGIALVISDTETDTLQVVWSHREYMLIKEVKDSQERLREIHTTLINAFLELGNAGVKALHEFNKELSIDFVQSAICAPWSFTITKSIVFDDEHPFEVTKEILEQLVTTAQKESTESLQGGSQMEELGLRLITDVSVDVELNGYAVSNPIGKKTRSITLAHICAVAQEKILSTIEDSCEKILPKAKQTHFSFMYLFYQVLKHLHPNTTEVCLIDVTNEATEIGIVRDNVLRHTTHAPIGMYSIARELAKVCDIPKEEAFSLLKEGVDITKSYSEQKQKEIESVFFAYQEKIAELFVDTGDTLSIPKTLFLHTSKNTESFFKEQLKKGAQKATGGTHTVHLFTSELIGEKDSTDTALALSTYYFHTESIYTTIKSNG